MKETVEVGFVFNPLHAGKGYTSEAVKNVLAYLFSNLNTHRVQAVLDARNKASVKLCERIGLRKEAHFIQDYWNKGEWTDSYVYAILKDEYLEL